MALTIRLRQQGRKNQKFYRLVVTDSRNPRDGKYIEAIGWYNPTAVQAENNLSIKPDRAKHWLDMGAVVTEKAEALIARGAPEVMKQFVEKKQARRVKMAAKNRNNRKTKATA